MLRKVVFIDEDKCDGCGLCIPNCAEGAIEIIDGKAKLLADNLCDGLGACLGNCPVDAIHVIEREADEFDEEAVERHLSQQSSQNANKENSLPSMGGCPGSRMIVMEDSDDIEESVEVKSQLRQWPVQLHLVPPTAPYLKNSDLLITADCVPIAYGNYHQDLLKGKSVVMGCPKLDDIQLYSERLEEMIGYNDFKSITVAFMEVPCCGGIVRALDQAVENAGKDVVVNKVQINIDGSKVIR